VHSWMGGRAPAQAKIRTTLQQSNVLSHVECEDKAGSADLSTVASDRDSLALSPRTSEPSGSAHSQQCWLEGEEGNVSGGEDVKVQHPTLESHGGQMSVGSELHEAGACVPCAFFCFKKQGCGQGADCKFCHMPHISNKKVRLQEWRKNQQLKQEGHRPRRGAQQVADAELQAQRPVPVMAAAASAGPATQRVPASAPRKEQPAPVSAVREQGQRASQGYQASRCMSPGASPMGQRRQEQAPQPTWATMQRVTRQGSWASAASKPSPTATTAVVSPSSSLSPWSSTASPVVSPAAARGQAPQSFHEGLHGGDAREPCFISLSSSGCTLVSFAGRGSF